MPVKLPTLAGVIAGVAALYPLSAGPVYKLIEGGHLPVSSEAAVDRFYKPIEWLGDTWPILGDIFLLYMSLWVDISL
jgi:hypothetical protein